MECCLIQLLISTSWTGWSNRIDKVTRFSVSGRVRPVDKANKHIKKSSKHWIRYRRNWPSIPAPKYMSKAHYDAAIARIRATIIATHHIKEEYPNAGNRALEDDPVSPNR